MRINETLTTKVAGQGTTASVIDARAAIIGMLAAQTPEIRDGVRVFKINDSKLWYVTDKQAESYLAVDKSEEYKKGMHSAEQDCIDRNIGVIVGPMEKKVSLIDMGCGNALMTIDIVKQAEFRGRDINFYPADISPPILELAVGNAKKAGIVKVQGLLGDFEKLDKLIEPVDSQRQRLFNLGANFVNFNSDHILSLISSNMRQNDLVYFSAQISNNGSEMIVKQYDNPIIADFAFATLAHVGIAPEHAEYKARLNPITREIECFVRIKQLSEELKGTGVQVGDELVVITSYKPSNEKFKKIANRYFDGEFLFDEEGTYVGFIGRKKNSSLDRSSEHYTAEKYTKLERSSDEGLQRYMAVEREAITSGIENARSKTFVDMGAGNGRVIPNIAPIAYRVIAIELNIDMFDGLSSKTLNMLNVTPVFNDVHRLREILSVEKVVGRPVLLLLQNTLAVMQDQIFLLSEMRSVAEKRNGEIVISLLKQEALESQGIPMYRTIQEMVGEPDLEKTDFKRGRFVSKTGYVSKWWTPDERESIKRMLGGTVVKEYEESNFYILHIAYIDKNKAN